jgi:Ser/Thr protein kinase RdoA (MazF antagonist)
MLICRLGYVGTGSVDHGCNGMKDQVPVISSTIAEQALLERLLPDYSIEPNECTLLYQGCNDTYAVKTSKGPSYVLRIYRYGWRTLPEISYEIDALLHLVRKGVSVSKPIFATDGRIIREVPAPEGNRYAVLFTYAAGQEISFEKQDARKLGRALGALHQAMDDFRSPHRRWKIDWQRLVEIPLKRIEPFFAHRSKDWTYVLALTDRLRQEVDRLAPRDRGFCHGDVHEWNVNSPDARTATFFDFDMCGVGWRVYDLATFRWTARWRDQEARAWGPFLKGYLETRAVPREDLKAVPLFVPIRHVWLMGHHAGETRYRGYGMVKDLHLDRHLTFLRDCERDYLRPRTGARRRR